MAMPLRQTIAGGEVRRRQEAAPQDEVRARAAARAAAAMQSRVRRLRQDPAPGSHPAPPPDRGSSASTPSRSARRRWCPSPAASRWCTSRSTDRRGAGRAQALHVPLHQRAAAREEAAPLHAVGLLLVLDPPRRPARAARPVGVPRRACSTRRSRRSRPRRRAASACSPTRRSSTRMSRVDPRVLDFLNDELERRQHADLTGLRVREGAGPGPLARTSSARASSSVDAFADGERKKWRLNHCPLFLDFLEGKVDFDCTAWGIPCYSVLGWQRPCYLMTRRLRERRTAS